MGPIYLALRGPVKFHFQKPVNNSEQLGFPFDFGTIILTPKESQVCSPNNAHMPTTPKVVAEEYRSHIKPALRHPQCPC
jgi:hypothetical protein